MSLKAMLWVMEHAPVRSHTHLAVLYALADRADDTGGSCYPSQDWIADKARCSTRTVRRALQALHDDGIISHGDQRHVAHIRADRRPTVWQLHLHLDRTTHTPPPGAPGGRAEDVSPGGHAGGQSGQSSGGANHVTAGQSDQPLGESRLDTVGHTGGHHRSHDRTREVARPDTAVSYKPSLTPLNPPEPSTPLTSPQGDTAAPIADQSALIPVADIPDTVDTVESTPPATATKRGTRLDESWQPAATSVERILAAYPGMTRDVLTREFDKFQNYWLSAAGRTATKRDWDRTWQNWMHTAVDRMHPRDRAAMTTPPGQQPATPAGHRTKQQQAHDVAASIAAEFATQEAHR